LSWASSIQQLRKLVPDVVEDDRRPVALLPQRLRLSGAEQAREVRHRVGLAQLMLQRIDECDQPVGQQGALGGAGALGQVAQDLRCQCARCDQQIPPQVPRLIEPGIAGSVPEREKDRERQAKQRERRGVERNLLAQDTPMRQDGQAAEHRHEQQLRNDGLQNRAVPDEQHPEPVFPWPHDHDASQSSSVVVVNGDSRGRLRAPCRGIRGTAWRCRPG
jgi:hypothetical protein